MSYHPLLQTHSTIYYWGPRVLRITARPSSSFLSYSYLSQAQGRDKKVSVRMDSVQHIKSQFPSGEEKLHTEPKTCMGSRLVPKKDRLAQNERVQCDLGSNFQELPVLAEKPSYTFITQTWMGAHTRAYTL